MQLKFDYYISREFFAADLQRFIDFLGEVGAEGVSELQIKCYPWRNGKRLQAVDQEGIIRPVSFCLEPDDARYEPPLLPDRTKVEPATIRERPDELGVFGLGTFFGHDD